MEKKKRILIVNNRLGYYGAENVLLNMVNHIDQNRYDITVLTLQESDASRLEKGIKYRFVFSQRVSFFSKAANKMKLLYGFRNLAPLYCSGYDVAIAFKMGECAKLVSYCDAPRKFCWIHSCVSELADPYSYSFSSIEEEKACLKKYSALVAVSQNCAASFCRKYGCDFDIKVIYNPVDEEQIRRKSSEPIGEDELPIFNGDIPIIGTVARIDSQKGIDRLIRISKRLTDERIRHKLVIVGDGVDYLKYADQVELEHLTNVFMLGFKNNPYKYMSKFDLFVCASVRESYSLVVHEALVLGVPVVSTKCGGPEEVLCYGKLGRLTENNEKALFEGVRSSILNGFKKSENYHSSESIKLFISEVEKLVQEA